MPSARKSNRIVIKIKINAAWPKRPAGTGESGPGAISSAARRTHFPEWMESNQPLRKNAALDFQNHRQNQRTLGRMFIDVTLQVHANFFLDDAPVGFFFGVGLLHGVDDHRAGAGN